MTVQFSVAAGCRGTRQAPAGSHSTTAFQVKSISAGMWQSGRSGFKYHGQRYRSLSNPIQSALTGYWCRCVTSTLLGVGSSQQWVLSSKGNYRTVAASSSILYPTKLIAPNIDFLESVRSMKDYLSNYRRLLIYNRCSRWMQMIGRDMIHQSIERIEFSNLITQSLSLLYSVLEGSFFRIQYWNESTVAESHLIAIGSSTLSFTLHRPTTTRSRWWKSGRGNVLNAADEMCLKKCGKHGSVSLAAGPCLEYSCQYLR